LPTLVLVDHMPRVELFDKEEVLDKALNLFWKKGYNGTSIRDIEKATGLGRSSLYNTFGGKEALFFVTLKRYLSKQRRDISIALIDAKSPIKAIRAMMRNSFTEKTKDMQKMGCFMLNSTTELANCNSTFNRFALEYNKSVKQMFVNLIEQAKQAGEISSSKDSKDLANYLFSSIQGFKIYGMLAKDRKELLPIIDNVIIGLISK
jgi:TetR/AcrR family transcriptional regulator, transcriptional repressor for nem operon